MHQVVRTSVSFLRIFLRPTGIHLDAKCSRGANHGAISILRRSFVLLARIISARVIEKLALLGLRAHPGQSCQGETVSTGSGTTRRANSVTAGPFGYDGVSSPTVIEMPKLSITSIRFFFLSQ